MPFMESPRMGSNRATRGTYTRNRSLPESSLNMYAVDEEPKRQGQWPSHRLEDDKRGQERRNQSTGSKTTREYATRSQFHVSDFNRRRTSEEAKAEAKAFDEAEMTSAARRAISSGGHDAPPDMWY